MLIDLFNKPFIGGIIGDANSGKSNLIYYILQELQKNYKFNLFTFGLKYNIKGANQIYSIDELERIKNSCIILDEFFTLLDLEDRRKKMQIERTLRLLFHNNNIIILAGLPLNFKKFISAKITLTFYQRVTFEDFINGSSVKKNILKYHGDDRGSSILDLRADECLVYDGNRYQKYDIPYIEDKDSKRNNVPIFVQKNVEEKCSENLYSEDLKNRSVADNGI